MNGRGCHDFIPEIRAKVTRSLKVNLAPELLRQFHSGHVAETELTIRSQFQAPEQDRLIEFVKSLQVLPPGTKDRIVDENFKAREWPPKEPR